MMGRGLDGLRVFVFKELLFRLRCFAPDGAENDSKRRVVILRDRRHAGLKSLSSPIGLLHTATPGAK